VILDNRHARDDPIRQRCTRRSSPTVRIPLSAVRIPAGELHQRYITQGSNRRALAPGTPRTTWSGRGGQPRPLRLCWRRPVARSPPWLSGDTRPAGPSKCHAGRAPSARGRAAVTRSWPWCVSWCPGDRAGQPESWAAEGLSRTDDRRCALGVLNRLWAAAYRRGCSGGTAKRVLATRSTASPPSTPNRNSGGSTWSACRPMPRGAVDPGMRSPMWCLGGLFRRRARPRKGQVLVLDGLVPGGPSSRMSRRASPELGVPAREPVTRSWPRSMRSRTTRCASWPRSPDPAKVRAVVGPTTRRAVHCERSPRG